MTLAEEQGTTHREKGTAKGAKEKEEEEEETRQDKTRHNDRGGRCRECK
jgi:hypothetical protein